MIFYYKALNSAGDEVSDYLDAPSLLTAKQKLRSLGLYLVSIKEHTVVKNDATTEKQSFIKSLIEKISYSASTRSSSKEVGLFSRQLATLLKAGLPLPVAINDIVEQIEHKNFKNIVSDLKSKIEEGSSFSNALQRHRVIFSDMYINMVRVGENMGSLDQVIERLADLEQKNSILKNKVKSALWYPAFMFFFTVLVVIFLMVKVVPSITDIFRDQQMELPIPTKIVMAVSDFLSAYWIMIPLVIIGAIYAYRRYAQTEKGRQKIDEIKLKLPLVKNLYNKLIVLRFTQNMGILLSNRVDIIKSFEIVQAIVGNIIIEKKISEAATKIREGSNVTNALGKEEFLPKLVIGMIAAGEASDNLDEMLVNIGNVYETEIDLTVTSLTSLIEPLIIIVMGAVIGTIVMSVMLPMMEMNMLVQ